MSTLAKEVNLAIKAKDARRVADLVIGASEKERRELREVVDGAWWHSLDSPERFPRMLARFGSATARQVASEWWSFALAGDSSPELTYEVLAARGGDFFATLARNIVEGGVQQGALLVRRALREGLIDAPPDHDAYVRGLVFQVGIANWREADSAYRAVLADLSLVEEIWQFFEVDCSTELTNAVAWGGTAGVERNRWLFAFPRLAADGILERDRLLDASLDALLRDFRPSKVGWYAKLHEELAPAKNERLSRVDRYLALLSSPVPSVVKEGLVGLKALGNAVDGDELARVASGPLSQRQKNLAMDTLGLLGRAAESSEESRGAVLAGVAVALGHERADVQERALGLLERYPDEVPQGEVLGFVDAVSPTLRARVEALIGIDLVPGAPAFVDVVENGPPVPAPAEIVPIEPVESVDELIELAASLMEGQGGGDDIERLLDGVSRLCAERPPGFERRVAGLVKRASEGNQWGWFTGIGIVQAVVLSWTTGAGASARGVPDTMLGFLARRAVDVASRAAKRNPRPLLALPTHSGGVIDPDVLAEREQHVGRLRNRPDSNDRLQARLRSVREPTPVAYSWSAVTLNRWSRETRHMQLVAKEIPLQLSPLRTTLLGIGRTMGESIWLNSLAWGSWDTLGARWCLTVLPANPEVSFAGAARLIVDQLDTNPQLNPQVALEDALRPQVPMGDIAWLAVGGALMAKSPDLQRVATDVVVMSVEDGRFDAELLADAVAWLVANGFAKVSRLQSPLRDIGRVSHRHAAAVVDATEGLLARLTEAPHGLHAPLEAVLEHAAGAGLGVKRPEARATLERFGSQVSRSSKLARTVQSLLALTPGGAPARALK
jgi:hypothetical protein